MGWPGSWAAEGSARLDTKRRPARMFTTVSVPMLFVLSNSWLAATERMARSLGRLPVLLEEDASCYIQDRVTQAVKQTSMASRPQAMN